MRSEVATGRRMKGRDGLMGSAAPHWQRRAHGPGSGGGAGLALGLAPGLVLELALGFAPPLPLAPRRRGVCCVAPPAPSLGLGSRREILALSLSLSAPSITTSWPGDKPLAIATFSPSAGPSFTGCTATVSSGLAT